MLKLTADREEIQADGKDLAFVTVEVVDEEGLVVPFARNEIEFEVEGPAEIVATDNGDPTNMTAFPSQERKAFSGKALVILKPVAGQRGEIVVKAKSEGLKESAVIIQSN